MAQERTQAERQIRALYGPDLPVDAGVIHVAAVWQRAAEDHVVLKIGAETPKSELDAFALSLSRVRADAILTTGGILRAEPEMTVSPFGEHAAGLLAVRAGAFSRREPPAVLILTRGDLPPRHPVLRGWARPIVVTGPQGARELRQQLDSRVHIVEMAVPTARAAITWARQELGAATVSVEAGPTTSVPLYDEVPMVDELMLSVLHEPPPSSVRGKAFVSPRSVRALFGEPVSEVAGVGPWRFVRLCRR
ncbi:MAG: hypothetical protein AAF721_30985 [Myxococcota bacterium]